MQQPIGEIDLDAGGVALAGSGSEITARASPAFNASAHAELRRQRGPAAPSLAAVDDVVVDEERVVEQLDCHGDRQDLGVAAAEGAACSHAECRAEAPFPGRLGYTLATRYSHRCGSPSGIASSIERRTRWLTSSEYASTSSAPSVLSTTGIATSIGSHRAGAPSAWIVPR